MGLSAPDPVDRRALGRFPALPYPPRRLEHDIAKLIMREDTKLFPSIVEGDLRSRSSMRDVLAGDTSADEDAGSAAVADGCRTLYAFSVDT